MPDTAKTSVPATKVAIIGAALPTLGRALMVPAPPGLPPVNPPGKRLLWLWAGLVVIMPATGAVWYVQRWVSKRLAVTTKTVTPDPLMRVLAVNGRVAPLHLGYVKSTVVGAVTSVLVDGGDLVAAGEVLVRLDAFGQQAIVRQAVAAMDAGVPAQAQTLASLARAEALGDSIARTTPDAARTAQQTASQEVLRLTALLDVTQIELAKYTLVTPMAGTILTWRAEAGQVVTTVAALFILADLAQLVVTADVDEGNAAQIIRGLPAVVQVKGGTETVDGSLGFVAPQVDAATRGQAVKIAFAAPIVAPVGLTVTANIIVDHKDSAISIPRAALVTA